MSSRVLRDALVEQIHKKMLSDNSIFFVSADFGSPALDKLRDEFPDRFLNVGIAEQNLINISTGLALEGYTVYAYAIAPFLTMRAYEQIRNVSLLAQLKELNINLVGVGIGLSYDVTGPTHHCLEDVCIMRVLPDFMIFSPADYVTVERFIDFSIMTQKPKYIRLDGKALPRIYDDQLNISIENGFCELRQGEQIGIISTGYMTHKALKVAENLHAEGISAGVIDVFMLKPLDEELLYKTIAGYKHVLTMEESFINKGGLDSMILDILRNNDSSAGLSRFGFSDRYVFSVGDREYLHKLNGLDTDTIVKRAKEMIQGNVKAKNSMR